VNETGASAIVLIMERAIGRTALTLRRESVAIEPNDEAFALLTRRHIDSAYRLAWAILTDTGDADDATQDAFAQAWRNRMSLRDPDRFDAWFGKILVNVCREKLRQREKRKVRSLEETDDPATADSTDHVSSRDAVDRALNGLDADHRIVIVLRYWADMTVDEIAERIEVRPGTVKSRLHYALRSMRPRLEDFR
jgi:RNA polymerase sigma-70 factor (ECF subfamily)